MKKLVTLFTLIITLTGCGNGFTPADFSSSDNGSNTGSNTNNPPSEEPGDGEDPLDPDVAFSATLGNNSIFGSAEVLRYNSITNALEILMPLNLGGIELGIEGSLPKFPNVSFVTSTLDNTIVLSIPLNKYLDLSNNVSELPGGRPLPGIPGGEPPSFGFPISRSGSNAYAYLAADYIALYAETNIRLPLTFKFPIKSKGQTVGYIHLLSPTANHKGGVFFSIQLPRELTALIESIK